MDNGILQVTLSNPQGHVTGIQYNGIENLLEVNNRESNRGYTHARAYVYLSITRVIFHSIYNLP